MCPAADQTGGFEKTLFYYSQSGHPSESGSEQGNGIKPAEGITSYRSGGKGRADRSLFPKTSGREAASGSG